MKPRIAPILENVSEATVACLVTMVQGNLLAFTVSHWIIASQTGVIAGVATSAVLFAAHTSKRWIVALLLGLVTGVVDYYVHPGMFGSAMTEAIVTGIGAAVLSYLAGTALQFWRARRAIPDSSRA